MPANRTPHWPEAETTTTYRTERLVLFDREFREAASRLEAISPGLAGERQRPRTRLAARQDTSLFPRP